MDTFKTYPPADKEVATLPSAEPGWYEMPSAQALALVTTG
jgi:hypothetical protein